MEPTIKINPNYANSVELRNLNGKVIISSLLMLYNWTPLALTFPRINLSPLHFSHLVLLHCGDVTLHELLSALKTYVIMGDIVHDALMVISVFLLIIAGFFLISQQN